MEGWHEGDALAGEPLAADLGHGLAAVLGEEAGERGFAQGDDDFGADDGDLLAEEGQAGFHFVGFGLAVAGGAALDDISDPDLFAPELHGLDDLGQEFARAADEGAALDILVGAGAFADEHELGHGVAFAGDDVGAAVAEAAFLAGGNAAGDGVECVDAGVPAEGGFVGPGGFVHFRSGLFVRGFAGCRAGGGMGHVDFLEEAKAEAAVDFHLVSDGRGAASLVVHGRSGRAWCWMAGPWRGGGAGGDRKGSGGAKKYGGTWCCGGVDDGGNRHQTLRSGKLGVAGWVPAT